MTQNSLPPPSSRSDHEWKTLENIQRLIERADSKAGFVAGLDAILFGFLSTHLTTLRSILAHYGATSFAFGICIFAVICYLILTIQSAHKLIAVVDPRVNALCPDTLLFANHIAKRFEGQFGEYYSQVRQQTDEKREEDILSQIVANSCIARDKLDNIKSATKFAIRAGIAWALALVLLSVFAPNM